MTRRKDADQEAYDADMRKAKADLAAEAEGLASDSFNRTVEQAATKAKTERKAKARRSRKDKQEDGDKPGADNASYTSCTTGPEESGPQRKTAAALLQEIGDLAAPNEAQARAILITALASDLSALEIETLIKPLAKALNVTVKAVRKLLQDVQAAHAAAKAAPPPTADERARFAREEIERREREQNEERDRLWGACRHIAESPTLLDDLEAFVHRLGVVGEGASVRGAYLTLSFRLLSFSPISAMLTFSKDDGVLTAGTEPDTSANRHRSLFRRAATPRPQRLSLWRTRMDTIAPTRRVIPY